MKIAQVAKFMLLFSSLILVAIGVSFGGHPSKWVPELYSTGAFDNVNAIAIFRSVLGLILGLCIFWAYAAFKSNYRLPALYSLMFVMFSLSASRMISFLIDGQPTNILIVYLVMELLTGFTVLGIIRKYKKTLIK